MYVTSVESWQLQTRGLTLMNAVDAVIKLRYVWFSSAIVSPCGQEEMPLE